MTRYERVQARAKALGMVVDLHLVWESFLPAPGETRLIPFVRVGDPHKPFNKSLDVIERELDHWESRAQAGGKP